MAQTATKKPKGESEERSTKPLSTTLGGFAAEQRAAAMPTIRRLAQRQAGGGLTPSEIAEAEDALRDAKMAPAEFDELASIYGRIAALEKKSAEADSIGRDLAAARADVSSKRLAVKAAEAAVETARHAVRVAEGAVSAYTRSLDNAQKAEGGAHSLRVRYAELLGDDAGVVLPDDLDGFDVLVAPGCPMPADPSVKALRVTADVYERESERRRKIIEYARKEIARDFADQCFAWEKRKDANGQNVGPEPVARAPVTWAFLREKTLIGPFARAAGLK